MDYQNILILAPHTDDGELGCGATISKYLREGKNVYYVAFSSCEQSLPDNVPNDTLKRELYEATHKLGIPKENVIILNYEVRNFASHRQEILDDMLTIGKKVKPDLVFIPSLNDIHQDHNSIAMEGLRAFKKVSIFCYEVPWNNFTFNNQAFSYVTEEDVQNKISAIKCYKSQKDRAYITDDYTRALLKTHGVQIGVEYAEVFEVPRLIL